MIAGLAVAGAYVAIAGPGALTWVVLGTGTGCGLLVGMALGGVVHMLKNRTAAEVRGNTHVPANNASTSSEDLHPPRTTPQADPVHEDQHDDGHTDSEESSLDEGSLESHK